MSTRKTEVKVRKSDHLRGVSRVVKVLERVAREQATQTQLITRQLQEISALKTQGDIQIELDGKLSRVESDRKAKEDIRNTWDREILSWNPQLDWPLNEHGSLEHILRSNPFWTNADFRWAYPKTAEFLKDATICEKSLSTIHYESFFVSGNIVDRWSYEKPRTIRARDRTRMPPEMWSHVKQHLIPLETDGSLKLTSRLLYVIDISPIVAAILLASTPKMVVSSVSPFVERYLSFTNFGKASMQSIKSNTINTFIFEYHFAFYYVTKQCLEGYLVHNDRRKLRKCSWLGQREDQDIPSRYIYEEQMSFVLTGHGGDAYTCYQLGERYFAGDPQDGLKSFVRGHQWTPSMLFLTWICMALHHVGIRWQNAIAAIDHLIGSEQAVVFHEIDNSDFGKDSKDRHILRLRIYMWALEAYKLFEGKLEATVSAWEQFKQASLDKVNDGRNTEDYHRSIEMIEAGIDRLRDKIQWTQKKQFQVLRLREGLFNVTSMLDTNRAIDQGENIKSQSYVTILYLPLSFCTSIFGMQMISQQTPMRYFSIVLLMTTISTTVGVFMLTGASHRARSHIGKITVKLICQHSSHVESKLIPLLREESRTPRLKRFNQTISRLRTGTEGQFWECVCFVAELCLVTIPVVEINNALRFLGSLDNLNNTTKNSLHDTPSQTHLWAPMTTATSRPDTEDGNTDLRSRARQIREVRYAEAIESRNSGKNSIVSEALKILLIATRVLLFSLWIPLVLFEYTILLFILLSIRSRRNQQVTASGRPQGFSVRVRLMRFFTAPLIFMGLMIFQSQAPEQRNVENPQTPPQPAVMEFRAISTSLSGETIMGDEPRSIPKPPLRGLQQWRHIVSQSALQRQRDQHSMN